MAQFALAPGRLGTEVLDYSSSEGIKLYNKATAPLENKYDLDPGHLYGFLQKVRNRAMNQNWQEICKIPVGPTIVVPDAVIPEYDLLTEYGRMTLAHVRSHAGSYQFVSGRSAQNAHQMYEFLYSSLDDDAQVRVAAKEVSYFISAAEAPESRFFNGPLFLKTIIGVAHIDTRATAAHIRQSMAKLPAKIASLNYDITKFNEYVTLQRNALLARGEASTDLLVNIFDAYDTVPDVAFKAYVDKIKDAYDEGDELVVDDYLMAKAEVKSKVLQRDGKYIMPSQDEKKIIALSAEFDRMKAQNLVLSKQLAEGHHQPGGNRDSKKRRPNTGKWAWKDVPPPAGSPLSKTVGTKTYHWCPKHIAWTIHLPSKCEFKGEYKQEEVADAGSGGTPNAQIAQALSAIVDEQGNLFHDQE